MKRWMIVLFAVVAAAMPLMADTEKVGGYTWTYSINGDEVEILGPVDRYLSMDFHSSAISPDPIGAVTIPSTLGGKPVTSIGEAAFSGCTNLTSVTIPDSVTSIGWYAFDGCSRLKRVTIPDSVTYIADTAFIGCRKLFNTKTISGVSLVDGWAVGTAGTLPGALNLTGVRGIGEGAFSGCSGLTSVMIPDSVTRIGPRAFEKCTGLTSVTIGNGVMGIGTEAFSRCSGLTSVTIGSSVTSIGYRAFYCCSGLTSVTIPDSVTRIGEGAFSDCSGLTSVTIGNGVTNIGRHAFEYCKKLTNVTIPDVVTSIGTEAFWCCSSLTNVVIGSGVKSLDSYSYVYATSPRYYGGMFEYCSSLTSVTIPNSVTNIGNFAFRGCGGLRYIYVSPGDSGRIKWLMSGSGIKVSSVNFIEMAHVVFAANGGNVDEANRDVALGCEVGSLPTPMRTGYTFKGWWTSAIGGTQISSSTIVTDNVTYYAHWTISQYTVTYDANGGTGGTVEEQDYETSITAPTVTRIGYTFAGWYPALQATVPASNVTYTAQWDVNQYTVTFDANGGTGGKSEKQDYGMSLAAPTVTRIGYTFAGWNPAFPGSVPASNVTYTAQWDVNQYTVTFDANGGMGGKIWKQNYGTAIVAPTVTREWCDFNGWSPAVAATVPANDVTYTAQWRWWGDSIPASAMGGETMKQLYPGDYAHMTTVVLEDGVTELPKEFFNGCDNVTSVTLPSTLVEFGIDDLPSKIKASLAYDVNGFKVYNNWILDYKNRNASALTIPDGIVGIGRGAFAEMYDLETVTMPESLRNIAMGAFEGCTYIKNLQFMSGLRHVGPMAFRECSSLLWVTFVDGVENIGTNAFEGCWQMQSVRLPYTMTNIGDMAFSGCGNIRGVTVPSHVKTMQELFPASYTKIETAEVADGENTVMEGMFAGCTALRSGATQNDMSMIPDSVTRIGARAFKDCTSLTAFVVPDSVTEMGASVFSGCTALWNVTLSRNLSALPDYAFYGCSMLETMVVPASVTYLGNRFFSGSSAPTSGCNALYYLCTNAPACHSDAYAAIAGGVTTYVLQDSRSWDGRQGSRVLPPSWNGYAITYWTPNRFDVTFDANGGRFGAAGSTTWSEQQITDTIYALPSTEPTMSGWVFDGWWTEKASGTEVKYMTVVTLTHAHTLYAHWRPLGEEMTVTFNPNGGSVSPTSKTVTYDSTYGDLPTPVRTGEGYTYTFDGWFTDASGGTQVTSATKVPITDAQTLYAHWTVVANPAPEPEPVTPDPVTPDPVTPDPVTPDPDPTPTNEVEEVVYGGVVKNVSFSKAQTAVGALYDAKGNLIGMVELKFGKTNLKKGTVKVSGMATMIIDSKAKKVSAKAANVNVADTAAGIPTALAFKAPIGDMELALNADGSFTLKNGAYEMVGAVKEGNKPLRKVGIGGALAKSQMKFNVKMDGVPDFGTDGTLLEAALPVDEPVYVTGGLRWSFDKAASLKYKKNKATGAYELLGLDDPKKPNLSGMKLSYTAKTGQFKGSFKLYATNEATTPAGKSPKLKAYTVNVIGFVVDGVGYGSAALKKPAATWSVTVK